MDKSGLRGVRASRTSVDYAIRIQRVVSYLAEHLDRPLTLNELAHVACFSPYHFHRVYRAMRGETPQDTVRRLRLQRAAHELLHSDVQIVRIASRAGYSSQAAFARAFREEYGLPPARFKEHSRSNLESCSELISRVSRKEPSAMNASDRKYEIEIITLPAIRLAAIAHIGDYQTISSAFERLSVVAGPLGLFSGAKMYGLYYDDPSSVPTAQLRSAACLSISESQSLPKGLLELQIEPGRYARVLHRGAYAELPLAYDYLYRVWLPSSGLVPRDAPCIEEYLNTPADVPVNELKTYVLLPLQD